MLTVAVCQFAPSDSREHNRAKVAEMAADAASAGAELIVFPEYSSYFVSPFDASMAAAAEPLDGEFTRAVREVALARDVTIVAGLLESGSDGRVRNTAVAVDASGIRAAYRKQHLYDAFGQKESDWVEPGDLTAPEVFVLGGFTVGLMTCYDVRFPEVARSLVDAGADLLVVPSEWVRGPLKEHQWETLLTARAIENTAFVVAADHPAPVGIGHSMIVDPAGVKVASVGTDEGTGIARLDPAAVARVRKVNPALALRRYRVLPR